MSSVKGSWSRVKDLDAWGKNWERAFKKTPHLANKKQESQCNQQDQSPPLTHGESS